MQPEHQHLDVFVFVDVQHFDVDDIVEHDLDDDSMQSDDPVEHTHNHDSTDDRFVALCSEGR